MSAETIKVRSPYNEELLQEIEVAKREDVESALELARSVFDDQEKWLAKHERVAILQKTVEIMKSRKEELTVIAANEGGKPCQDSKVEVDRAINGVMLAIEQMGVFAGKEIAMGHTPSSVNRMAYTMKEPIGVVASISAFNHPLNLIVHQSIPAIAVGAPVIIKPSALTPMSALNFVEILYEAGLPKAWCQVVVCHKEEAEYLATSEKIDYLSFIGSAKVGWHLRSKVAPGTRVGLEHGGAAPVIVESDAEIESLIPALTKGGFYHAGQVCVSVQRVYAHEDICSDVAKKLAASASSLIVGNPLEEKTEVGPLISHEEVDRVEKWVKEAVEGGAELLCGGKRVSDSCFEPTVLLNPPKDAKVSMLEVFAPVVCIYSYAKTEDALKEANALEFSFQAAVFTKNIDRALLCAKRLNATTVMINDHTAFRVDWMPFGGAKASGLGLGGIPYSMNEMSKDKLVVIKSDVL